MQWSITRPLLASPAAASVRSAGEGWSNSRRDGGNELIGQPTSDEMDETSPVLLRQVTRGDGREA